ncbi:uncharacterized protein LOC121385383 isoform X2 [Gigantopelta aegis]|uniref:uncharacterized protein LOC121385383 isoform X2 n=1 Tax=Gigantopelta aegis TaxID=1735272 RepID=UPI001B8893CB|nr:uncharacterized protein LOC121385383 isoform X2 [Gigantopelta aegis]
MKSSDINTFPIQKLRSLVFSLLCICDIYTDTVLALEFTKFDHQAWHLKQQQQTATPLMAAVPESAVIVTSMTSVVPEATTVPVEIVVPKQIASKHNLHDFLIGKSFSDMAYESDISPDDVDLQVVDFELELGCGSGSGGGDEPTPLDGGGIAGIVIGIAIFFGMLIVIIIWIKRRKMFCFQSRKCPNEGGVASRELSEVHVHDDVHVYHDAEDPNDAKNETARLNIAPLGSNDDSDYANVPSGQDKLKVHSFGVSSHDNVDEATGGNIYDSPNLNRRSGQDESANPYEVTSPENTTSPDPSNVYDLTDRSKETDEHEYSLLSNTAPLMDEGEGHGADYRNISSARTPSTPESGVDYANVK